MMKYGIQKDWKAKLESVYSFMLKYLKITVCTLKYVATAYTCFECKLCLGKDMFLCQELCKTYVG